MELDELRGDTVSDVKQLLKNTVIIGIGKFSTQFITFLFLPFYTSLLSTSEYGTYDLINTLSLLLIPFITLLMEEAMFRFLIDSKSDEDKKKIITQSILVIACNTIIVLIIISLVLIIARYEYGLYLVFYVITAVSNSFSQSLSRGMRQIKLYSLASFLTSVFNITLNIVFLVVFPLKIKGMLLAFIISNIVVSIFVYIKLDLINFIEIKNFSLMKTKQMLKYSLPLVPNNISWVIINLSDRLIISGMLGTDANGIYSIANKFPSIINTFYSFFYTSWQESAAKSIGRDEHNNYYNFIYFHLKRFLFAIVICLISFMPFIFNILIDKNYNEAYKLIPLLVLSILFSNISGFYGGIYSAHKDTSVMGKTTVIAAITNLIISISLIKYIGLYAAVLSSLVSSVVVCLFWNYKMRKYIIFCKDLNFYLISTVIFVFVYKSYMIDVFIINLITLLIAILYSIFINKEILKIVYNWIIIKRFNDRSKEI